MHDLFNVIHSKYFLIPLFNHNMITNYNDKFNKTITFINNTSSIKQILWYYSCLRNFIRILKIILMLYQIIHEEFIVLEK